MVLSCAFALMGVLAAAPVTQPSPDTHVTVSAPAASENTRSHPPAPQWLVSAGVRMFGMLAVAGLAMSAALAVTAVAMLGGALGFSTGAQRIQVGTDVSLGLAALAGLGAGVCLVLGLGAGVVTAFWWVADLATGF